jgi:hypothetical protein
MARNDHKARQKEPEIRDGTQHAMTLNVDTAALNCKAKALAARGAMVRVETVQRDVSRYRSSGHEGASGVIVSTWSQHARRWM